MPVYETGENYVLTEMETGFSWVEINEPYYNFFNKQGGLLYIHPHPYLHVLSVACTLLIA